MVIQEGGHVIAEKLAAVVAARVIQGNQLVWLSTGGVAADDELPFDLIWLSENGRHEAVSGGSPELPGIWCWATDSPVPSVAGQDCRNRGCRQQCGLACSWLAYGSAASSTLSVA